MTEATAIAFRPVIATKTAEVFRLPAAGRATLVRSSTPRGGGGGPTIPNRNPQASIEKTRPHVAVNQGVGADPMRRKRECLARTINHRQAQLWKGGGPTDCGPTGSGIVLRRAIRSIPSLPPMFRPVFPGQSSGQRFEPRVKCSFFTPDSEMPTAHLLLQLMLWSVRVLPPWSAPRGFRGNRSIAADGADVYAAAVDKGRHALP